MERYTVKFSDPHDGPELAFLLPLTPTSTVSTLLTEAKRRAAIRLPRLAGLAEGDFVLRYGGEEGPILDGDDILAHMLPDPKNEIIFVSTPPVLPLNNAEELGLVSCNRDLDPFYLHGPIGSLTDCRILVVEYKQRPCEIQLRRSENPGYYSCFGQETRFRENDSAA